LDGEDGCEYVAEDEGKGKEGEDGATFAEYVLIAASDSIWHDTMDVPITATDLSAQLMIRRSRSSLLPV